MIYEYIFRDKLYSSLEKYVQEGERSNLSKTCDEIEDWLYGDGEDQPKSKFHHIQDRNLVISRVFTRRRRVLSLALWR